MFEFIARLQEKPDKQKRAIALGVSIGTTSLIVLVWLSLVLVSANNSKVVVTQEDVAAQQKVANAEASPLDGLRQSAASVGSAFVGIKNFFGGFGKVNYDGK